MPIPLLVILCIGAVGFIWPGSMQKFHASKTGAVFAPSAVEIAMADQPVLDEVNDTTTSYPVRIVHTFTASATTVAASSDTILTPDIQSRRPEQ